MSTADTTLSIFIKMAPGPDHRQEPVAPNRINENLAEIVTTNETAAPNTPVASTTALGSVGVAPDNNIASISSDVIVSAEISNTDTNECNVNQTPVVNATGENKQEEPAKLATLNEGELRALLDEAITYKSPKDREGKSNLFKELLQEAEADETEEGRRKVASSRCIPGSNRRRHKRDSVSERLTHGGSLQNLAQPINSEFDSSFAYLTSGSSHTYGGGRRKGKKHTGPSVSARQREGGSLPSNVNASHSLASLANLDLVFDKKKRFSEERTVYDWTNKEKSKSLDKPSYVCAKKEDKDKDKKETVQREIVAVTNEADSELREKKGVKGKSATNEMLESDNPPPEYKSDYMVIDFDIEVRRPTNCHVSSSSMNDSSGILYTSPGLQVDAISERNALTTTVGAQRPHSLDTEDDEGTEMKVIESRRPVQVLSRSNFDTAQTPIDTAIEFPIREQIASKQLEKPKVVSVNGTETSAALPLQTYNSVKCVVSGTLNLTASTPQGKVISSSLYSVMPVSWPPPNIAMEAVSRLTAQHIPSADKKSLDENGNAVQGHNGERKKVRRKHTQEPNVIVYKAENVEGHRNIEDIDTIVEFIENKESKGKKGKATNAMRVKTASGAKPRTREKDSKREQLPAKLQKSNSLEEISKTKLEDLTAEKSTCSSGASSITSQHGPINVALRRAKQRSTGDSTGDSRGDRRSWGTEEGQSIYCNDTGDDYTTRRNLATKKNIPDTETEMEFFVVTKKKKSKKQRRSSSGGRAQNLASSGSYLQRTGGFSNDYRTPLSPELRRKSTSSMPPSDKSDSSDLDSVHSLPVTSNSSKHNLTKNATSSGGTPQASYADIARTATINISPSAVLNISTMVPNMLNAGTWPSVPAKTPSEPDKFPQDYPSLDEIQQTDKKLRSHAFAHTNHAQGLNLSFDKPPSPILAKTKITPESKKAEAREEAINKNIQVFKYVQDIEKMHQSITNQQQQATCSANSSRSNPSPVDSGLSSTNSTPPKFGSLPPVANSSFEGEVINSHDNATTIKEVNANTRVNFNRSRRNYQQALSESGTQRGNSSIDELNKLTFVAVNHHDDSKKSENQHNLSTSSQEELESIKAKSQAKSIIQAAPSDSDNSSKGSTKTERISRTHKDQQNKTTNAKPERQDQNSEVKRSKQQNNVKTEKNKVQKSSESQQNANKRNNSSRPAVILLDESVVDPTRNSDAPSELTFGFEVNEQLLLSDEAGGIQTKENPVFIPEAPQIFDKPPPNYDRPPPMFAKQQQQRHVRYEKLPPNFPMHPSQLQQHHHGMTHPQAIITLLPYVGYTPRFQPLPPSYQASPPPPSPSSIMEKYHHQPKEDFSARYVAPEEAVNVQNYNHDKIVTFVGSAWDAVMREIPLTAAKGRVQYYNGQ